MKKIKIKEESRKTLINHIFISSELSNFMYPYCNFYILGKIINRINPKQGRYGFYYNLENKINLNTKRLEHRLFYFLKNSKYVYGESNRLVLKKAI